MGAALAFEVTGLAADPLAGAARAAAAIDSGAARATLAALERFAAQRP